MTTTSTPRLTKQTAQFLEILFSQLDLNQSCYARNAKVVQQFNAGTRKHIEDSCSSLSNITIANSVCETSRVEYFASHANLGLALNDMFPSLRQETKGCVTKAIRLIRAQLNNSPNY